MKRHQMIDSQLVNCSWAQRFACWISVRLARASMLFARWARARYAILATHGVYLHYKGDVYVFVDVARHSETNEQLVVYAQLTTGQFFARPLEMFLEHVLLPDGRRVPRFKPLDPDASVLLQRMYGAAGTHPLEAPPG